MFFVPLEGPDGPSGDPSLPEGPSGEPLLPEGPSGEPLLLVGPSGDPLEELVSPFPEGAVGGKPFTVSKTRCTCCE